MNWTAFRQGFIASLPYQLAISAFGMATGAALAEAGLTVMEALAMSVIVLAGAAQLTAMQLLLDGAPIIVILLSAICVNLRFSMYSAAITPYMQGASLGQRLVIASMLHDQSFGASMLRFQRYDESRETRISFFLATGGTVAVLWQITTVIGHIVGARAPEALGLNFATPVIFIAMASPFMTSSPRYVAAAVASAAALLFHGVPYNLGLLIAASSGIAAGFAVESHNMRKAAA